MFYDDLFSAMDDMFSEEKYAVPQFPHCEVRKNKKNGTVKIIVFLAGYKKDEISVTTEENRIVVATVPDYKVPDLPEDEMLISSKGLTLKPFKSSFLMPETKYDFNGIAASIDNGVLTLTVPPKEKKEYKAIDIAWFWLIAI